MREGRSGAFLTLPDGKKKHRVEIFPFMNPRITRRHFRARRRSAALAVLTRAQAKAKAEVGDLGAPWPGRVASPAVGIWGSLGNHFELITELMGNHFELITELMVNHFELISKLMVYHFE